jgi:ABC-type multidrug transport system fused ATPase/permease subunit
MVINPFYNTINKTFDQVEHAFEGASGQRRIGTLMVAVFLLGLTGIQLNRFGLLPPQIASITPTNHLEAIELVFTLLLVFEVLSLLFSLVYSVSISVGKQVEILSLVLLRDIFKEISNLHEPIIWKEVSGLVLDISALAFGALVIFVILNYYYRQIHQEPLSPDDKETASFIIAKKLIALLMMIGFLVILAYNWWFSLFYGAKNQTFESFYTLLVFSDILIMLFSMRYGSSYRVAFRNSGFAVSTLLIRVALITPPLYSAMLGVGCALLVLGIRVAYNYYMPSSYQQKREQKRREKESDKQPIVCFTK